MAQIQMFAGNINENPIDNGHTLNIINSSGQWWMALFAMLQLNAIIFWTCCTFECKLFNEHSNERESHKSHNDKYN